jgi:flagellar biosynthesis protein FliR
MTDPSHAITDAMLVFCRIGGCVMTMPGLSSIRVPARIRLFAALGLTVALLPAIDVPPNSVAGTAQLGRAIAGESLIGAALGLGARMFAAALEFIGTVIAQLIGLSGVPGVPIDEGDAAQPLGALLSLTGTVVFFALDLHVHVMAGVVASYDRIPIADPLQPQIWLILVLDALVAATRISLQLAAPFLILGVLANLAFGLLNRFAPQVQLYFLSVPIIVWIGLFALQAATPDMFNAFGNAMSAWVMR